LPVSETSSILHSQGIVVWSGLVQSQSSLFDCNDIRLGTTPLHDCPVPVPSHPIPSIPAQVGEATSPYDSQPYDNYMIDISVINHHDVFTGYGSVGSGIDLCRQPGDGAKSRDYSKKRTEVIIVTALPQIPGRAITARIRSRTLDTCPVLRENGNGWQ